jgi:hypothetical protein
MELMKQFILTTFASATLVCAQGTAPIPTTPDNPPSPPGAAAQPAVAPDKVVLSVGSEKITAKEFDS